MSVFKALRDRRSQHASKKTPDQLDVGQAYTCFLFTQRRSDYPDKSGEHPMTLVAHFLDPITQSKYYVTMPGINNNLTEDQLKELNDEVNKDRPPFIVMYGKDGSRNELILHEFGESIDTQKLTMYSRKRSLSSESEHSPAKLQKNSGSFSQSQT